jgi:hypothetical protein
MIVNKIEASELITLDLINYLPKEEPVEFDLKNFLFKELILKEKDFRTALINTDWSLYNNKIVRVFCSADVIIPVWAYMLAVIYLKPVAKDIFFGDTKVWQLTQLLKNIQNTDLSLYQDKKVVIKGCGDINIPDVAYFEITKILYPVIKSIMYGEPCSTVPIYKRK